MPRHGRRLTAAATLVAACALPACGTEDDFTNTARPPAPITVSAVVTPDGVDVSPATFGAGPVDLVITNQTKAAQQVTLSGGDGGVGAVLRQETPPINPDSTASLTVDFDEGEYRLDTGGEGIRAGGIRVGPPRPSAQDDLLLP